MLPCNKLRRTLSELIGVLTTMPDFLLAIVSHYLPIYESGS